jgi:hypothetical protein
VAATIENLVRYRPVFCLILDTVFHFICPFSSHFCSRRLSRLRHRGLRLPLGIHSLWEEAVFFAPILVAFQLVQFSSSHSSSLRLVLLAPGKLPQDVDAVFLPIKSVTSRVCFPPKLCGRPAGDNQASHARRIGRQHMRMERKPSNVSARTRARGFLVNSGSRGNPSHFCRDSHCSAAKRVGPGISQVRVSDGVKVSVDQVSGFQGYDDNSHEK